jgi:hypothetical protein
LGLINQIFLSHDVAETALRISCAWCGGQHVWKKTADRQYIAICDAVTDMPKIFIPEEERIMNVQELKQAEIELQSAIAKMEFNGEHRALNLAIQKAEEAVMWLRKQIDMEQVFDR